MSVKGEVMVPIHCRIITGLHKHQEPAGSERIEPCCEIKRKAGEEKCSAIQENES